MEITKARYKYNRSTKKQNPLKKFVTLFLIFLICVSGGGYTTAALTKTVPELSVVAQELPAYAPESINLPWPATGQAAIGSLEDGVLARSSAVEVQKPIASMTKIVTALTIMKQSPFEVGMQGKTHTITAEDITLYNSYVAKNGSVMPVRVGQTITQYQAMQALLLASANNMADALVYWNFDSMENYLVAANELIRSYGLTHTVIADASGFSPQTISTPSDLIILGQKALSDPVISRIVAMPQAEIPGVGLIKNTNKLLNDAAVVGIKTGTTDEAGSCLLFAAKHKIDTAHEVTVIGVVMAEPNGQAALRDSRTLLDASFAHFGAITLLPAQSVVGEVTSAWGQRTDLVTSQDLIVYGWKGSERSMRTTLHTIDIPLSADEGAGIVEFTNNSSIQTPVVSRDAIIAPSNSWRLKNVF